MKPHNPDDSREDILVVDDTLASLRLLTDILAGAGYPVRPASDGALALRSVQARPPALILLDIRMPGMDGYEVCRRLKADEKTRFVPVIFISVLEDEREKIKGFQAGGVDYINKPFRAEEILARVGIHLALRRAQADLERRNEELRIARDTLEERVKMRTAELTAANASLKKEVAERERVESELGITLGKLLELRTIINRSPVMVFLWRAVEGWPVEFVSDNIALFGYSPSDFKTGGLQYYQIVHPDDLARVSAEVAQNTGEGRDEFTQEYRILTRTGQERWLDDRTWVRRDATGAVTHFQGIVMDATERKKNAVERERLFRQLEDKNAELERVTYTVSHDLKSPLITIKGFLGMIREDMEKGLAEQLQQDIDRVDKAADRMRNLLDELLQMSRIERIIGAPEDVSLTDLAREAAESVSGQIRKRNVRLEIDPELPRIRVDRARFLQVMENLIDNAVKFMGDQPEPRITVGLRRKGDESAICVADNGIGIDPAYTERIFQLFEKLDQSSEGTGVGLAIVKRIVEMHGGRIWAESPGPGRGTDFCFTLPMGTV